MVKSLIIYYRRTTNQEYEDIIYNRIGGEVKSVLSGEVLGIPREFELVAYHDTSAKYKDLVAEELKLKAKYEKQGKKYDGYWINLEPVCRTGKLIFYAEKKKQDGYGGQKHGHPAYGPLNTNDVRHNSREKCAKTCQARAHCSKALHTSPVFRSSIILYQGAGKRAVHRGPKPD